ncbi:hypothetical protein LCGC14_1572960 [marine sediment metagenome]|uniref:Uncharacterized protein n=1 Tax=marine sediment metagenome TaxID=412755 RepID=A0A0F9L0A9_9ZZZZ
MSYSQKDVGILLREAYKQHVEEFLRDLESLPIEHVSWVDEHSIRKSRMGEVNIFQSSMIFLPDITRLKFKWRNRL